MLIRDLLARDLERKEIILVDQTDERYVSEDDRYWAAFVHFGHRFVHIPESYVRTYDRLLTDGFWAQATITHRYDEKDAQRGCDDAQDLLRVRLLCA